MGRKPGDAGVARGRRRVSQRRMTVVPCDRDGASALAAITWRHLSSRALLRARPRRPQIRSSSLRVLTLAPLRDRQHTERSMIYILHFDTPYHHARHYVG